MMSAFRCMHDRPIFSVGEAGILTENCSPTWPVDPCERFSAADRHPKTYGACPRPILLELMIRSVSPRCSLKQAVDIVLPHA